MMQVKRYKTTKGIIYIHTYIYIYVCVCVCVQNIFYGAKKKNGKKGKENEKVNRRKQ